MSNARSHPELQECGMLSKRFFAKLVTARFVTNLPHQHAKLLSDRNPHHLIIVHATARK